jgi:hypothetical protein
MPELYTSLLHAKMELNGGAVPPMTLLTEVAAKVLDPAATPGMGALHEDAEKGLLCPVRGCGEYRQDLTKHLNRSHRDIGGAATVRLLLDIPAGASFVSTRLRRLLSERAQQMVADGRIKGRSPEAMRALKGLRVKAQQERDGRATTGARNLRAHCEAQLKQRVLNVYLRCGRSPSIADARLIDPPLVSAAIRVFGSWNNVKAQMDLERYVRSVPLNKGKTNWPRERILSALFAWYEVHGRLPTQEEADRPTRTPVVPTYNTVRKILGGGVSGWADMMRQAAVALNIYCPRYNPRPQRVA